MLFLRFTLWLIQDTFSRSPVQKLMNFCMSDTDTYYLEQNELTLQNCSICMSKGMSNRLSLPLILVSRSIIKLLHISRLGFSKR